MPRRRLRRSTAWDSPGGRRRPARQWRLPGVIGRGAGGGAGGFGGGFGGDTATLQAAVRYAQAHGGGTIGVASQSSAAAAILSSTPT